MRNDTRDPDEVLDEAFEQVRYMADPATRGTLSRNDALAHVVEATIAINDRLEGPYAGWRDKLEKWLTRLLELVRLVAGGFEANGFSIAVGTTVSVTFTWEPSGPQDPFAA